MNSVKAYIRDVSSMWRLAGDRRSFLWYAADRLLLMFVGRIWVPGRNKRRQIRLRDSVTIHYRLNRGDMQSIREVWLQQCYQLPAINKPRRILVDLGANIGLTSMWFKAKYGCQKIIAIEPVPENASLAMRNFAANEIPGTVITAAIGPSDGSATFEENSASNLGRIGVKGYDVRMLSMKTLLGDLLSSEEVNVLKVDIEGGEEALFKGDLSWLKSVAEIVIEFHPTLVDCPPLVDALIRSGFEYCPSGSCSPESMDYFRRVVRSEHPELA
jgi:FkbM family methyltransferase